MPVGRTLVAGSPYIGVYVRAGERGVVVPPSAGSVAREVERLLGGPVVRTTVADTEIVGALVALNSNGIVTGEDLGEAERRALEGLGPVTQLRSRQNAMGNNLLANDHGVLAHPEFSDDALARISAGLGVPARRGTIAGLGTVGMAAVATNRGVVVHPKATEHEVHVIEELLGVPVHRSTANFGVPIVGACLAANSRAMMIGRPTTPVELAHLAEGLSVFD